MRGQIKNKNRRVKNKPMVTNQDINHMTRQNIPEADDDTSIHVSAATGTHYDRSTNTNDYGREHLTSNSEESLILLNHDDHDVESGEDLQTTDGTGHNRRESSAVFHYISEIFQRGFRAINLVNDNQNVHITRRPMLKKFYRVENQSALTKSSNIQSSVVYRDINNTCSLCQSIDNLDKSNSSKYDDRKHSCLLEGRQNQHKHIGSRQMKFFQFIIIAFILTLIILYSNSIARHQLHIPPQLINQTTEGEETLMGNHKQTHWLVSNSKCHIPIIDPWHSSIVHFFNDINNTKLDCEELLLANGTLPKALSFVYENKLFFHPNIHGTPLNCCFREITRMPSSDDKIDINANCTPIIVNGLWAPSEYVKVECEGSNYTGFHQFMKHDLEEEAAMERLSMSKLNANDHYNLIILGIDTISRLNSIRQLNETRRVLLEQFGAIEFFGYNKVGENTFPNIVPLLTGLTPEQLLETQCWHSRPIKAGQRDIDSDEPFDNCKFLWNYFQELGYFTYFQEDWPFASTFNYLKEGFRQKPTLHYGRPLTLARSTHMIPYISNGCSKCLYEEPFHELDLQLYGDFIMEYRSSPQFGFHWINCPQHDDIVGASLIDSSVAQFLLDIKEATVDENTFVVVLSDHGYRWGDFVETRIGHYEASLPMLFVAPPKQFLKQHPEKVNNLRLHQHALLTPFDLFESFIHIRNMSRLEPGLTNKPAAIHPYQLAAQNEAAMRKSTELTEEPSPINHVTQLPDDPSAGVARTIIEQIDKIDGSNYQQSFRKLSIFENNNHTQLDRSCTEAGIPDNYCVCHQFQPISVVTIDVLGAAYYYVYVYLHEIVNRDEKMCRSLDLNKIEYAELFEVKERQTTTTSKPNSDRAKKFDPWKVEPKREYNLRVSTTPGSALFQEVIRYYGKRDLNECQTAILLIKPIIESKSISVKSKNEAVKRMNDECLFGINSNSISRLNLYRDQSGCIKYNDVELKKVCFCRDITHHENRN